MSRALWSRTPKSSRSSGWVWLMVVAVGLAARDHLVVAGAEPPRAEQFTDGWPESKPWPPIQFAPASRPMPESPEEAVSTLHSIKELYDPSNVPEPLNIQASMESAYEIIQVIMLLRSQLPLDKEWLEEIEGINIPGADKSTAQTFDNPKLAILARLEQDAPMEIDRIVSGSRTALHVAIEENLEYIRRGADVDLSNALQVRKTFGSETTVRFRGDTIRNVAAAIDSAILFDTTLDGQTEWTATREEFRAIVARYHEKLVQVADVIKPPKEVGDPSLASIAQEAFSRRDSGVPVPERIFVITRNKLRSEMHYAVDFDARTIATTTYRWEEFRVATIEKEGDRPFLWYTSLRNYSVGPRAVPAGQWVFGPRQKGAPIAEAHASPAPVAAKGDGESTP